MALEPLPFRGLPPPPGFAMFFLHPRFRRPLERGSMSGVTKRCNGIKRKGTQSPSSQRRPAFSIVGVKIWRTPKGQRLESHTKTLMERASSRNQLSLLPMIGGRFGEWFEAPSYEEGVGVDGKIRGPALGWGLGVSPVVKRSRRIEPLFKGRRKQGCKKTMARPEGAQALRAIQEALDGGRFLPVVNYILPI